jgi:hypothetical protein
MKAGDVDVRLASHVTEGAKSVWREVSVGLEAMETEAAVLLEKALRADAGSIPGGRKPDRFGHG